MTKLILLSLISFSAFAQQITVSGISSGAYMAQQFLTAFSSQVNGVGIVAGGPYFCAKGKIIDALNRCMKTSLGVPRVQDSVTEAKKLSGKFIDPISNLKHSRVYAISGTNDETVLQKVSDVNVEVYKSWGVPASNIQYVNKLAVGHAFPTDDYGNSCSTPSQSPFISNCGRDVAGEMLKHLLGNLFTKKSPRTDRIFKFEQLQNLDGVDFDKLSMHKMAFAYIPEECEGTAIRDCRFHVAFHGCKQTLEDIQTTFVTKAGYNGWAEANKLVIVYPQAIKNFLVNNPNGCWDWWGYTGSNYHTREGLQMKQVARVVEALREGKLQLISSGIIDQ
jgi:hypothetical protein